MWIWSDSDKYYAVIGDNTKGIDTLANVHINKINPIYVWQAAKTANFGGQVVVHVVLKGNIFVFCFDWQSDSVFFDPDADIDGKSDADAEWV